MKIVIALALFAIVLVLAFAGRAMLTSSRDSGDAGKRMARALALRVALSIALFVFILVSYKLGWIHPTGIPLSR
ncbi:MAG TPA: DUF2909 domain-containing protein [Aquabacterium sp.]|nr:DUF2909 domain-containing protein [Aquabacterium sp.]